ncbi:MAG: hypothetical protein RDU20_05460 [Desulfomonilaceae bacterium]|nr:hypothetical protein [Desulfomonilaceae bacterium]
MRTRNRATIRGLRDIRTHAGRVESADVPYMRFMKISALEMEKARRETEKFSAEARIRNIDLRLAEIEAEKETLLAGEGGKRREAVSGPGGERSARDRREGGKGFRIKY